MSARCDRCQKEIECEDYFTLKAVDCSDVVCKSSTIKVAVCPECWLDFLVYLGSGGREKEA